jgi:hypothetical protein
MIIHLLYYGDIKDLRNIRDSRMFDGGKSVSRLNFSNSLFRIILIMVMCGTILRTSNREGMAIIALIF